MDPALPIEERFEHYPAWQAAMELVHQVYEITEGAALDDAGSVAIQMRATAIVIPSKIAAGVGSGDPRLLVDNLSLAYGAIGELRTLCYVATDMDEIERDAAERIATEVTRIGKMITRMTDNLPAAHPEPNGHGDADVASIDD